MDKKASDAFNNIINENLDSNAFNINNNNFNSNLSKEKANKNKTYSSFTDQNRYQNQNQNLNQYGSNLLNNKEDFDLYQKPKKNEIDTFVRIKTNNNNNYIKNEIKEKIKFFPNIEILIKSLKYLKFPKNNNNNSNNNDYSRIIQEKLKNSSSDKFLILIDENKRNFVK